MARKAKLLEIDELYHVQPDDIHLPERYLIAAVLQSAIHDLLATTQNACTDTKLMLLSAKRNAHIWIFYPHTNYYSPLSFDYCCDILSADPRRIRRYVRKAIKCKSTRRKIVARIKNWGYPKL